MGKKTALIWKPLTEETKLIPDMWYLLSDGVMFDAGEYIVENGIELFCVYGHYIERQDCKYTDIAQIFGPICEE